MKIELSGRRFGKSQASEILAEKMLDAGKTVVFCSKDGALLKKRRGHLTLIQELKPLKADWFSIDEWSL